MGKLFNLARMTTATTGTGTITLGSAVSGYLTFAAAGVSDGDVVTYAIADGANSEIGLGTYTASGTTLTRSVIKSTNSDAAINLSGSAEVFVTAAAEDLITTPGTRNRAINGGFDVWMRGGGSFTSNGYTANQWRADSTGSSHAVTRQAFTLGQTDVAGNPAYHIRSVVSSSAGSGNYSRISQRIEYVRTLAASHATVSFDAKADTTRNIAVSVSQNFGTTGSPSTSVETHVEKFALTSSWQRLSATVLIPSVSGKTLGTDLNDYLDLRFWFDAGSSFNTETDTLGQQSGTFDIANVQIEPGVHASAFEYVPLTTETLRCERYAHVLFAGQAGGAASVPAYFQLVGTTVVDGVFAFSPTMRGVPALAWPLGAPTYQASTPSAGNTIGFYNNATPGFATATGGVTYSLNLPTPRGAGFRLTAGTSFTGTGGGVGNLYVGPSVVALVSAEL